MGLGRDSEPAIAAGSLAGITGLVVFLLLHQLWIVPIWFIAPVGAVIAGLGGAAMGASYSTLRSRLPRRPWTAVAVVVVVGATLAPAILIGELRGPIFAMSASGGGRLLVPAADALVDVLLGLFGVSAAAGAALGALIGRSRRATVTTMLAAIALALGPGHNIPLLAGSPAVVKELTILGAVVVVSAITLVETAAWLGRGRNLPAAGALTEHAESG